MHRKSKNSNVYADKNNPKKKRNITTSTVDDTNPNVFQTLPRDILYDIITYLDFIALYKFLSICNYTHNLFKEPKHPFEERIYYKLKFFREFGNYFPKRNIENIVNIVPEQNFEEIYKITISPKSSVEKKVLEYTRNKNHEKLEKELRNSKISCMFHAIENISPLVIASRNGDMEAIELLLKHEFRILGGVITNLKKTEQVITFLYFNYKKYPSFVNFVNGKDFGEYFAYYILPAIDASLRAKDVKISRFFLEKLLFIFKHKEGYGIDLDVAQNYSPTDDFIKILDLALNNSAIEAIDLLLEKSPFPGLVQQSFLKNLNMSQKIVEIFDKHYGDSIDENFIVNAVRTGNKKLANFYCQKKGFSLIKLVITALERCKDDEELIKGIINFYPEMSQDQQDELIFQAIYFKSKLIFEISNLRKLSVDILIFNTLKKRPECIQPLFKVEICNQNWDINSYFSSEYINILVILMFKFNYYKCYNLFPEWIASVIYNYHIHPSRYIINIIYFGIRLTSATDDQETESLTTIIKKYFSIIYNDIPEIIQKAIKHKHKLLINLRQMHEENYFTTNTHINDPNHFLVGLNPDRTELELNKVKFEIDLLFDDYDIREKLVSIEPVLLDETDPVGSLLKL